jgi:DNA (cytosine-5)-methyltransferase 1
VKGGHFSMVSAALVGVGGRAGDSRPRGLDEPTATGTAKADVAIATAFLEKSFGGNESPGWPLDKPISTVTTQDHHRLVTAHLTKFRTGSTGAELVEPMPTITAGPKENPAGAAHALGMVSSHLVKLRGTSSTASMEEPLHTISAQGQHHAEVRAFLMKYYSTDQDPRLEEPLHTITTVDRFGLVTIHGQDYQIVDIGLRMLAPHELYKAQGFPDTYVIDEIPDPKLLFVNGRQVDGDPRDLPRITLPKSSQVRMCGNSVCPTVAEALIRANFVHEQQLVGRAAA